MLPVLEATYKTYLVHLTKLMPSWSECIEYTAELFQTHVNELFNYKIKLFYLLCYLSALNWNMFYKTSNWLFQDPPPQRLK